jgi:hypothetical protein
MKPLRTAAVALSAVSVIALGSACGRTETVSLRRAIDGASADLPSTGRPVMKIRNIFVLGPTPPATFPVGADAPFYASIAPVQTDRLLSVTSPAFAGSRITGGSVATPGGDLSYLRADGRPQVVLTGAKEALRGGENIRVTMRFERSGETTVLVPVIPRRDPYDVYPTAPGGSEGGQS